MNEAGPSGRRPTTGNTSPNTRRRSSRQHHAPADVNPPQASTSRQPPSARVLVSQTPDIEEEDVIIVVRDRIQDTGLQSPFASSSNQVGNGSPYELLVIQQPQIGAELGLSRVISGRLPIIPALIVELKIRNPTEGETSNLDTSRLLCTCSLQDELGSTVREGGLTGSSFKSVQKVKNLNGRDALYFIFDDVGVREGGSFRLELRLVEALPNSPILATTHSEAFNVVPKGRYPGRPPDYFHTELIKNLRDQQGISLYAPPLIVLPHLHYI